VKASGTSAAVATTGSATTHHRSPAKGRICWLHPIGDSQDNQPGSPEARSPTARMAYDTPTAAMPRPIAARPDVVICAVTPPIAVNTTPLSAQPRPNDTAPTQGSPTSPRPIVVSAPRTRLAPMPTTSAADSGAARPTTPADTSSSRPASSSDRVCRTATKTNRIATSAAPKAVSLISERAPTDVGSYTLPYIATSAAVALIVSAAETNDCLVG